MRRTTIMAGACLAAVAALLAGCASDPVPAPAPTPIAAAPPVETAPASVPPAVVARDTCGAAALADVVGKPRTSIPIPVDLTRRRVVCTACPRTQEFRPDRQTILYDAQTGRVMAVTCG